MLSTSAGVEPATSWSPVGRRIQLSHRGWLRALSTEFNETLLSADRTSLLTDKEAFLKRWAEHFDSVLNRPASINDNATNRLPQVECNLLHDEFPTLAETAKAIKHLSSGKAPGSDAIPAEIYKAGGTPVAKKVCYFTLGGEKKPSLKNSRKR